MEKRFLLSLLVLLAIMFMVPSSCTKDCPDGYSGEDCEKRESDPFVASYEGFVNCGPANDYTTLDIYRESGPFDVTMNLVYPPDFSIQATVHEDTLIIPQQIVATEYNQDTSYYILFDSQGYLQGDTLSFSLILLFPGIPDQERITCHYEVLK